MPADWPAVAPCLPDSPKKIARTEKESLPKENSFFRKRDNDPKKNQGREAENESLPSLP